MAPSYTRTSTADSGGCTATTSTADSGRRWYTTSSNSVRADTQTDTGDYTYYVGYYEAKDPKEEERLLKLAEKEELMEGWFPRKPELRPIKRRSSVQLRGVRLDGRGWA